MILKPVNIQTVSIIPIVLNVTAYTCDIFCCVIDNLGDAGVCLRLAKQLGSDYGLFVRLWCDDVQLLMRLEPTPSPHLVFYEWDKHITAIPASIIICGFGCALSEAYLQSMVALQMPPKYIHLEYLSAEKWVETTHGLESIHPRLGLKQFFCNPGFNQRTGGLLINKINKINNKVNKVNKNYKNYKNYKNNNHFGVINNLKQHFKKYQSNQPNQINQLKVFCFAYDLPPLYTWITAVQQYAKQTNCLIKWVLPHTAASKIVYQAVYDDPLHQCHCLPFLSQTEFDIALNACDIVWVRGEDSAMTAMFSGLPMLWQLYPQTDIPAKNSKLSAYLDTVQQAVGLDLLWCEAMQAANTVSSLSDKTAANEIIVIDKELKIFKQFLYAAQQASSKYGIAHIIKGNKLLKHQQFGEYCCNNVPNLAQTIIDYVRGN